ncbi:CopG protein [Pseudomonas savastanoi pv. glycinea]|nr:CopG protein [Pseudomonas savastanoi pv. glycinea]
MKFLNLKTAGRRIVMLIAVGTVSLVQAAPTQTIDVHRDPNCGCCSKWIAYLRDNGFTVNDHMEENMSAVKARLGVPDKLASCHTGVVNGKFVEGHVPVQQIAELAKRADLKGVAAPGMPMGSPGMESGNLKSAYQVTGLTTHGEELVVADYPRQ